MVCDIASASGNPASANTVIKGGDRGSNPAFDAFIDFANVLVGERPVIVEMFVNAIGEEQLKFRTALYAVEHALVIGGAPGWRGCGKLVGNGVARYVCKRKFGVPDIEAELSFRSAFASCAGVVVGPIVVIGVN